MLHKHGRYWSSAGPGHTVQNFLSCQGAEKLFHRIVALSLAVGRPITAI